MVLAVEHPDAFPMAAQTTMGIEATLGPSLLLTRAVCLGIQGRLVVCLWLGAGAGDRSRAWRCSRPSGVACAAFLALAVVSDHAGASTIRAKPPVAGIEIRMVRERPIETPVPKAYSDTKPLSSLPNTFLGWRHGGRVFLRKAARAELADRRPNGLRARDQWAHSGAQVGDGPGVQVRGHALQDLALEQGDLVGQG